MKNMNQTYSVLLWWSLKDPCHSVTVTEVCLSTKLCRTYSSLSQHLSTVSYPAIQSKQRNIPESMDAKYFSAIYFTGLNNSRKRSKCIAESVPGNFIL